MEEKRSGESRKFYTLKSDLMFHIVMQTCRPALKSLVAAVLHVDKQPISSVEVLNPIKEGEHITDKKVVLDLLLKLNDGAYMNMELQVRKYEYMTKRALFYWNRSYNSINSGEDYELLSKVYQVCILDYVLFEEAPKFFAEYKMTDPENGQLFSEDINIRVICLPLADKAESGHEDLVYWAKIFNAKTYNELKSLAKGREEIEMMVEKIKETNDVPWYLSEEEGRLDYERREKAIYREAMNKGLAEGREKGLAEGRAEQKSIDNALIAEKDAYIKKLEAALKLKQ